MKYRKGTTEHICATLTKDVRNHLRILANSMNYSESEMVETALILYFKNLSKSKKTLQDIVNKKETAEEILNLYK